MGPLGVVEADELGEYRPKMLLVGDHEAVQALAAESPNSLLRDGCPSPPMTPLELPCSERVSHPRRSVEGRVAHHAASDVARAGDAQGDCITFCQVRGAEPIVWPAVR